MLNVNLHIPDHHNPNFKQHGSCISPVNGSKKYQQNIDDESGTLLDEDLDLLINDIANDNSTTVHQIYNNEQALLDIDFLNTQENNDDEL